MKEILTEAAVASAILLSPHPSEQPHLVDPTPGIEVVAGTTNAINDRFAAETISAPTPSDGHSASGILEYKLPSRPDKSHNLAIIEGLDPETIVWLGAGIGSLTAGGAGGFLTSRRLKKKLRKNHTAIKSEGWSVQSELDSALEAARQQVLGLHDDDVSALRELIQQNGENLSKLVNVLASSNSEFNEERSRFFPRTRRLREATNTQQVIKMTGSAAEQAKELRAEIDKVQTDIAEIDTNIEQADSAVQETRATLHSLVQKGWNVATYQQNAATLAESVSTARAKRTENYIEEPTKIAKATTEEAVKLQDAANNLEPRRAAADESYSTQADRLTTAQSTAEISQARFAKLQENYHPGCLDEFENVQEEIARALTELGSAHETASSLIGQQGKSVEAVIQTEELNTLFDDHAAHIQKIEEDLQEREEYLAELVERLPRKVAKLSARFDRASTLVEDPDIEGETADEIRSLAPDIASLSASITVPSEQKPNYLGIEDRRRALKKELKQVHEAAIGQKQEMCDLRTEIPDLANGYNNLVTTIKEFTNESGHWLEDETWNAINQLHPYEKKIAANRQDLRKQRRQLENLLRNAHDIMEQAEYESDEDGALLTAAKVAGGTALALIGIDLLD